MKLLSSVMLCWYLIALSALIGCSNREEDAEGPAGPAGPRGNEGPAGPAGADGEPGVDATSVVGTCPKQGNPGVDIQRVSVSGAVLCIYHPKETDGQFMSKRWGEARALCAQEGYKSLCSYDQVTSACLADYTVPVNIWLADRLSDNLVKVTQNATCDDLDGPEANAFLDATTREFLCCSEYPIYP